MIIKGPYTNIWGHPYIHKETRIGAYVEIGSTIENSTKIGKCKIEAMVFIPPGVTIEDDVFIGPGVYFANDKHPKASGEWKTLKTIVRKGVSIGMRALIGPGIEIGENAVIGMGTIVTRDVKANTIVFGNPARINYSYICELCRIDFLSQEKRGVRFCSRRCYYLVYKDPKKREEFGFVPKDADIARKYKEYKTNSDRRTTPFGLTIEEFSSFWQKPCFYCDDPIETIGLDRVDNTLGYVIKNLVSCCWECNRIKANLGQAEFFEQVKKIYEKHW